MQNLVEKQIIQPGPAPVLATTVYPILLMISISHLLNDTIQSLIPSIYPLVKTSFHLNFAQVGLITLTFQLAASLLQPLVGHYTDRRPNHFSCDQYRLYFGRTCQYVAGLEF
jgi:MFS family permease